MPTKRMVCLANSFKNGGRCVAGVELVNGQIGGWIRPVSNRPGHALNFPERTYANNTECSPLDIIEFEVDYPVPAGYQSENWLITAGARWRKIGTFNAADLAPALHNGAGPLWPHTGSTNGGSHDKIDEVNLAGIGNSLALIQPQRCNICVSANPFKENRLDVRASFNWGGQLTNLKITDPVVAAHYQGRGAGTYPIQSPIMCISVGEVFAARSEAYKLVAAVIQ